MGVDMSEKKASVDKLSTFLIGETESRRFYFYFEKGTLYPHATDGVQLKKVPDNVLECWFDVKALLAARSLQSAVNTAAMISRAQAPRGEDDYHEIIAKEALSRQLTTMCEALLDWNLIDKSGTKLTIDRKTLESLPGIIFEVAKVAVNSMNIVSGNLLAG
jgi:hypothetical protein